MKIAIFHNLPSGGARRAMVEMVKRLASRGHIIDEFCPETANLSFLPLNGMVRRTTVLPFSPLGIATRRVPMLTPYMTATRLMYDLRSLARLGRIVARLISDQDYNVVFTHDCQIVLAPDVLRFLQQPSVHYFHAGVSALQAEQEPSPRPIGLHTRLKAAYFGPANHVFPSIRYHRARRNIQAATLRLTNSRFSAGQLAKAFSVDSEVCYLGVETDFFQPLHMRRESFVLSVGAVHYYKGYRFLLQALGAMPEDQRPRLVIAANSIDPSELEVLQAMATARSMTLTIRNVSAEAEMAELYNRAAAFVYCPIQEPWGLAAVEAMACGTPIVAVSEGGVAESVVDGETGLLTRRSPEDFAEALARVLSDPELAARLGRQGVKRARERFTWSGTADRLETHFEAVINAPLPR
jgi:glycosyltransferase involved in cell wall biosynthesis